MQMQGRAGAAGEQNQTMANPIAPMKPTGQGVRARGSRVGTGQRALVVPADRSLGIVCVNQAKVAPPSGVGYQYLIRSGCPKLTL